MDLGVPACLLNEWMDKGFIEREADIDTLRTKADNMY